MVGGDVARDFRLDEVAHDFGGLGDAGLVLRVGEVHADDVVPTAHFYAAVDGDAAHWGVGEDEA